MKLSRAIPVILIIGSISTLLFGCAPRPNSVPTSESEIVTVRRGDLTIDITAVGNLALSLKDDLAFEIPGTVEEVLVEEGDTVEEGQVLARLDTSKWEEQLTALERQVTTAERQLTTAEKQLRDKKRALVTAENQVTAKEYTLRQAQLDLQTANNALSQIADVKKVQDEIDNAEYAVNFAQSMLTGQFGGGAAIDYNYWSNLKTLAEQQLAQAQKKLQEILAGLTVSSDVALEVAKKQLQVEQRQLGIKQAQLDVEDAKLAVGDARKAIESAQVDVENAQEDLKTAQKNLDEAKSDSPEVKAPFAGFITKVNVKGGDEVKKGTIAVQLADPTGFEADVLVNETDISQVRLGGTATVEMQAILGVSLPAKVTHLAPTATIQQGVVNYKVTVELQSLQPVTPVEQPVSTNVTSGSISSVAPSGRAGQIFGSGNLTQEQINQMRQQRQQALAGQSGGQSQAMASAANIRLAEGMTVTVSLPVESRTNVVLVPNAAVTTRGGQAYVKVASAEGVTGERLIQTGISDWQYTEVTGGLSEGEKVVITRTTTTTRQSQTPAGGMFPRMGGFGR